MPKLESTLKEELDKNKAMLTDENIFKIFTDINYSINILHSNKIVHFDIKMKNIFHNKKFDMYFFSDFGESKIVEHSH